MDVLLELKKKIRHSSTKVVFPEGEIDKIILAASRIAQEEIARPILLGRADTIRKLAVGVVPSLEGISIVDMFAPSKLDPYAKQYSDDRDLPIGAARLILSKPVYFGAMMVKTGDADAMVGGIATPTEEVVMASELFIGMQEKVSTPSAFFLMEIPGFKCEEGNLLIFADAALNPNPTSEQLADIAISSARSARKLLDWEPRIAFLSFSTKGSAMHPDVDKVVEAVRIAREREPDVLIDGELQADAAIVPEVARKKTGGTSSVAGRANILIFPDLDAGNIGYKLVQRLAKGAAYGPFLQGFARPVSDLSRGATVDDIVGATILVVIEAQKNESPGDSEERGTYDRT
jgi:phosphate acetyltransferase